MKPEAHEDPEAVWLRDVYKPNDVNLTVRAVIAGMLIGCVMCVSNIYVFFKTGWSMGVTITACILAFAVFKMMRSAIGGRDLGMLENNALTTVASGAGYMTGGGNMAAFGALLMLTSVRPPQIPMVVWFAAIAALGVFAAIPIKRQLINKEGLAFPTGTATAETLRSIHGASPIVPQADEPIPTAQVADAYRATNTNPSDQAALQPARALAWAAGFGALVAILRDIVKVLPGAIGVPFSIAGHTLQQWTLAFKTEVILLGAGALMSFRTGWSVLLGGILTYGVLAPSLFEQGLIKAVSYKAIVEWTVWPGAALLVGSGLTSFALDYKSLGRAFTGLGKLFGRKQTTEHGIAAVEVPEWWFPAGFAALTPIVVFLMAWLFQIPVWAALIAVPLAVLMGFVAARVTGETDVTPTKALGPVTQMVYGVVTPGNLSGNIMSANVTAGVGLHAADLLTTLKTGWLLGAKPRHQLYAQLFGVLIGAAIVVPAFNLIIPDVNQLGGEEWPAPSCVVWAGVSKAFAGGIDNLSHEARIAIGIGLALGIALALLEKFAPKRLRTYLPSASGLGIAMVVPGSNCIAMFIGASLAEIARRRQREGLVVPIASGLIAGESLMGVAVALMIAGGVL